MKYDVVCEVLEGFFRLQTRLDVHIVELYSENNSAVFHGGDIDLYLIPLLTSLVDPARK
jgi:hypothetical protein